jgi:multisubunit Na+/H+ antiporter MnhB subunit
MGNVIRVAALLVLFAFLLISFSGMRPFGSPADSRMDDYFIRNGEAETANNNLVTAVTFDYRGIDTLGEASVLFAAATGVFLVFGRGGKQND